MRELSGAASASGVRGLSGAASASGVRELSGAASASGLRELSGVASASGVREPSGAASASGLAFFEETDLSLHGYQFPPQHRKHQCQHCCPYLSCNTLCCGGFVTLDDLGNFFSNKT